MGPILYPRSLTLEGKMVCGLHLLSQTFVFMKSKQIQSYLLVSYEQVSFGSVCIQCTLCKWIVLCKSMRLEWTGCDSVYVCQAGAAMSSDLCNTIHNCNLIVLERLVKVITGYAHSQWLQSLFRCRIVTFNFSMGFNNIAPYMECVAHK